MARPRTYEKESRIHVGVRYDKAFIALFDRVAAKQGLSRTQALDWCMRDAIRNLRIPPFAGDVDVIVEQERQRLGVKRGDGDGDGHVQTLATSGAADHRAEKQRRRQGRTPSPVSPK